ncbi:MAG: 2-C-methyl-D-erythritol 2,4-cyclodiphosphate synthase [Ezakiella sp.]|nr:2-C-methyl-D-erythritol 2,4-cyclodiphosphate synthase [Ezakiella sp.]MDD7761506.1 2-C-methyl-D-erythritol 2,4-cyclodiphosphate synthase [Bacillota bacterium]MDY3947652.1 2-C-methyl-D-erythritol 2,4-cyclodiphosphate synthase [Ezakiella sp.]
MSFRIGQGYDIHIIKKERPLIIGGVKIRDEYGLLGHSDADVLVHAIMDALLGASGLRDIGYYFPDTSDEFKDISSLELLSRVDKMIKEKNKKIANIDTIIVAERPKLKDYIPSMIKNIAEVLDIEEDKIAIKATTKEKMDSTGSGLAIESYAIALLEDDYGRN